MQYRLFTVFFGKDSLGSGRTATLRSKDPPRFRWMSISIRNSPSSLSSPPRTPDCWTVRLLDCQTESGDAELRDFSLFCPLRLIRPSWLAQPPGCNSPATSQSASVPSWHAPSATAKRYQAVSLLKERGLKSQVDPMRPPSPHRPGPHQLHQLRLDRQRMSHEAVEAHPPASAQSPDAPRQQQWDEEVAAHSAFATGRPRAEREHCRC